MKKVSAYLNEKFEIDDKAIDRLGAFDSFVDEDALFFVDPLLIKKTSLDDFSKSYEDFLQHFRNIISLLLTSSKDGDECWRAASRELSYKEKPEFGLGYTGKGRDGSGIGDKLRNQVLTTISKILRLGVTNPVLFELIGAFEEGIGFDRISDMTCSILYEDFLKYTERILEEAGCPFSDNVSLETKKHGKVKVVPHPVEQGKPIVLVPKSFLRTLLVSDELGNINNLTEQNNEMKRQLREEFGKDWKDYVGKYKKNEIKEYVTKFPKIIQQLIEDYEKANPSAYDLEKDLDGRYRWYEDALKTISENPLAFSIPPKVSNHRELIKFVEYMINHFKDLIENKGLWRNLYRDEGTYKDPHNESYGQNLFRACCQFMCDINNLDLNPEVDGGRGPVDFKVSRGSNLRVLVEIKKSTNSKLIHAVEKQVPIYQQSTGTHTSYIVTIEVNGLPNNVNNLKSHIRDLDSQGIVHSDMIYVDGNPKESASKAE